MASFEARGSEMFKEEWVRLGGTIMMAIIT